MDYTYSPHDLHCIAIAVSSTSTTNSSVTASVHARGQLCPHSNVLRDIMRNADCEHEYVQGVTFSNKRMIWQAILAEMSVPEDGLHDRRIGGKTFRFTEIRVPDEGEWYRYGKSEKLTKAKHATTPYPVFEEVIEQSESTNARDALCAIRDNLIIETIKEKTMSKTTPVQVLTVIYGTQKENISKDQAIDLAGKAEAEIKALEKQALSDTPYVQDQIAGHRKAITMLRKIVEA